MIYLPRYSGTDNSTLGLLFIEGKFEGYTLELPDKNNKRSISCVKAGVYKVRFRKEETPLTKVYRKRYVSFFKWHIEIIGIPNRDYIYLHIGNEVADSDGCILLADSVNNNHVSEAFIYPSLPCYERIYKLLEPVLNTGDTTITITDM